MPKLNKYTVTGLIYITFWVSVAIADVGEVFDSCSKPNTWYLPVIVLFTFAPLFIAGYLGGKH